MKIKFIIPILFFLFVSCTDEDDSSFIVNSPPILVKKIITKNFNDNSIINITEFEYSGNKIIKSTDLINENIILYTYSGELISNIKIKDINNNLKFEYLYSYENNKLTQSIFKNIVGNISEKRLYVHNSDSNVSFDYYKGDLVTQNVHYKSGTILVQNGEVVSIDVQNFEDSSNKTINHIYDNKNNPQKNILGFDKLKVELDRFGGVYQNVISTQTINNGMNSQSNNSFTYNTSDYPTESTVYILGTSYYKMEYFY